MHRTHTLGELTSSDIGKKVVLSWRVNSIRDHWGIIFVDLRDRYGITQIKADPKTTDPKIMEILEEAWPEYVLKVQGKVVKRPQGTENPEIPTWEIEVIPSKVEILSKSEVLPFPVDVETPLKEETRMEYRYLDLRRQRMQQNIIARAKITQEAINHLINKRNFLYIETPALIKNTPEGAREYIVPSRHSPWKAYVLPQSPQQLKQILMVSGFDRYVQLARCFRDEDLRGDRQPEFTQIDLEMSFVEQEDVLNILEDLFIHLSESLYPSRPLIFKPFERMSFDEAMDRFGIDKPELRTQQLQLQDLTEIMAQTDLHVFKKIIEQGGVAKAIVAPKVYTRWEIDKFEKLLKEKGAKGLAYFIVENWEIKSPLIKYFSQEVLNKFRQALGLNNSSNITVFVQVDEWLKATDLLGYLRNLLIKDLNLLEGKQDQLAFARVVDFPMFEYDEEANEIAAMHHPFTKPKDEYIPLILELAQKLKKDGKLSSEDKKQMMQIKADAYDLVLNGYEIWGGNIRIHDAKLQEAIFVLLGLTPEQIQNRFGHMLKAFSYWVPPHWGFAVGFDRAVMVYQNEPNIREVIAFPKTQKWEDLMLKAPSEIEPDLLKELGLEIKKKK